MRLFQNQLRGGGSPQPQLHSPQVDFRAGVIYLRWDVVRPLQLNVDRSIGTCEGSRRRRLAAAQRRAAGVAGQVEDHLAARVGTADPEGLRVHEHFAEPGTVGDFGAAGASPDARAEVDSGYIRVDSASASRRGLRGIPGQGRRP